MVNTAGTRLDRMRSAGKQKSAASLRGFLDDRDAAYRPDATHLFCAPAGVASLEESLTEEEGGTRVTWTILPPEVCTQGGPLAGDPWAEAPPLQLTLPEQARQALQEMEKAFVVLLKVEKDKDPERVKRLMMPTLQLLQV